MSEQNCVRNLEKIDFAPRREAGLSRLQSFVPVAGAAYARLRNFDYGPENRSNISCLSPWIRHRALLESEVIEATLCHQSPHKAEKFLQEVFWRGYFKGWLEHHPSVWVDYLDALNKLAVTLRDDSALRGRYEQAIDGRTGIDGFDEWVRELYDTGYLHNHSRMWFASIWIFTLQLPWQLGADLFFRHLIDGDPASNTLSWRWVAGLHTVGKNYLARPDNIAKYTNGRFNPQRLNTNADALYERDRPTRHALSDCNEPMISGRTGLLITLDDCCLDQALHAITAKTPEIKHDIQSIAHLIPGPDFAGKSVGDAQKSFTQGILRDAAGRMAEPISVRPTELKEVELENVIKDWISDQDLDCVVMPYAPVGPTRRAMKKIKQTLQETNTELIQLKRPYDRLVWPHATKGFFGLKKKIPDLLPEIVT